MNKLFTTEIIKFYNKLLNNEKFAIARYGDGEMIAMRGQTITSGAGEWNTNGTDPRYQIARNYLHESFTFKDDDYYVGIVCPCCQGQQNFMNMVKGSGQDMDHLTYANLFVNGNYKYFLENFIPFFKDKEIVLVANEVSKIEALPFSVEFYPVKYNAWIENINIIEELKSRNDSNKIYLLACGPLGKILSYKLWQHNKNNTYLDVGSTLHPWLESDKNIRGYYGAFDDFFKKKVTNYPSHVIKQYSDKICIWGNYE
jgi:hypothetical protein